MPQNTSFGSVEDFENKHPINVEVGERFRTRRMKLHLSVPQLAELLSVSPERLVQCEQGDVAATPPMLLCMSSMTGEPVQDLLENIADAEGFGGRKPLYRESTQLNPANDVVQTLDDDAKELLKSYNQISDRSIREQVRMLVKNLRNSQ